MLTRCKNVSRCFYFLENKVCADICGASSTVGLSTTTIFGYFGGYFFGDFRDKASLIIMAISNALPAWMTYLSGYFMSNSVFVPALLDSEGSTFKNNCVKCDKHRPILSAAKMLSWCVKRQRGFRRRQFSAFSVAISSETLDFAVCR